jgi:tricarballylate dehydrogenase
VIRGTPIQRGRVLRLLLDAASQPVGDPRACHAVPSMAVRRSSTAGIVTRLDSIPLGIAVNARGERFYDEGEDVWPKRYATWGSWSPSSRPDCLLDCRRESDRRFMPSVFPPIVANSIREMAAQLNCRPKRCTRPSHNSMPPSGRLVRSHRAR